MSRSIATLVCGGVLAGLLASDGTQHGRKEQCNERTM